MTRHWLPAGICAIPLTSLLLTSTALAQGLTIAGVTAEPGTTTTGIVAIAARGAEPATSIPFTLVAGARPGPVLTLVAGTHGYEYAPILALQRMAGRLDPKTLAGSVILVHVANVPSFLGRTIYYSPVDGKNLNRVFPGKADGTISERIADAISREFIDRSTHVVDIHCGDGNESLRPYSYWVTTGDPKVAQAGRAMALAFGLDHIIVDRSRPTDPAASVYLSNTAILRGKPGLTIESGGMGLTDEASIARIERGVAGVLLHLAMRPDGPAPVEKPIWIGRNEVLRATSTGILHPVVGTGETVAAGTLLAWISDFHGRRMEEVRSPFDGEVLYILGTPPITAGEPVAFVGARDEGR